MLKFDNKMQDFLEFSSRSSIIAQILLNGDSRLIVPEGNFVSKRYEQKNKRSQGKSYRFYDLTIPIFSSDMNKAYVELTLYGSGAQALYLEKINSKWTIIRRIGLWIS